MTDPKVSFWRKNLRWLPGAIISLAAIFFVARLVKWEDLGPAIKLFLPWYALATIGLTLVFLYIRAAAWRVLLNNQPKLSETFWAINQGYLLNNILPFRLGEVGRAALLSQQTGLPTAQIFSSVIIERSLDLAIAAGMLLATLPLALDMVWAKPVTIIMLIIVVALLVGLYFMARFHEQVGGWIEKTGSRWKFFTRWIAPQVRSLLSGLSALTDPRRLIYSIGLILLSWFVAIFVYWITLFAIAPNIPYWWGVFVDAVLALGIAIPSAPAALGTYEAAMVGALSILGINQTSGLAYAITLHFLQILVTGVLGITGLMRQGRSLGNLFHDLQNRKNIA
ncbi:MAG: lysylphosphatidylglycerol synthase transmembrane domain-containing protein [Bellilinea sp.]